MLFLLHSLYLTFAFLFLWDSFWFFFSLTPEDSYPPLCVSAQPSTTLPPSQPNNPYFSVMPLNPVVQQVPTARAAFPTGYMRPAHQRLTRTAISGVDSRDSREFRWNRVLRYVHDVSSPHRVRHCPLYRKRPNIGDWSHSCLCDRCMVRCQDDCGWIRMHNAHCDQPSNRGYGHQ